MSQTVAELRNSLLIAGSIILSMIGYMAKTVYIDNDQRQTTLTQIKMEVIRLNERLNEKFDVDKITTKDTEGRIRYLEDWRVQVRSRGNNNVLKTRGPE